MHEAGATAALTLFQPSVNHSSANARRTRRFSRSQSLRLTGVLFGAPGDIDAVAGSLVFVIVPPVIVAANRTVEAAVRRIAIRALELKRGMGDPVASRPNVPAFATR